MGSRGGGGRSISQEAFEEMVRENMEDLGMEPAEALEDAIHALSLQGVDLTGIVKCIPGTGAKDDDPVLQVLHALNKMVAAGPPRQSSLGEMVQLLDRLRDLCSCGGVRGGAENASIAVRNGAVEMLCSLCSSLDIGEERALLAALKALRSILHDTRSTDVFQNSDGPKLVMHIVEEGNQSISLMDCAFAVIAVAATGNEIVKESFMDLKIDELFLQNLKRQSNACAGSMYDAIRVLLTPDDDRVLASQVYGYARRFAQVGIADALVVALKNVPRSPSTISVCTALKAVAVNNYFTE
uniref:Armadillo repeat-containing protein 6 n=1 Tax=Anthurium amnicola TaxID=1678845 RepID=A0A1D1XXS1_9ARAE